MIDVRGVRKAFLPPRSLGGLLRAAPLVKVLDGVDLWVERGRVVALRGDNGSGKSTLLRLCAGVLVADAGMIAIDGLDPARQRREVGARLGYLPADDRGLPLRATVGETARFFAALRGIASVPLDGVGVDADRRVGELSTGQRRRVQLACALAGAPALLLLDEPTRGLDDESTHAVWARVRAAVEGGATVLCATHSADEASALGATVVTLRAGRIAA